MKHIDQQTARLNAIPPAKLREKHTQTAIGAGVFLLGVFLPVLVPPFPIWFAMAVAGAGGWIASKELVQSYLGYIPAVVKDVLAALANRGK